MNKNKKCNIYQNKMDLYVEKQLPEKEILEWELHIAECSECKKELSLYNILFSSLSSFPQKELPYGFSEKLHYLLQDAEKEKSKKQGFIFQLFPYYKYGLAAAILLLIVGISSVNINLYNNKEKFATSGKLKVESPAVSVTQPNIHNIVVAPQKKVLPKKRNVISKKIEIHQSKKNLLPSYTEIIAKESFLDEKVLKIDIASDEYLRNIKLKIELSNNILFVGEDNKTFSNSITKDNLDITPTPWTLLLPVLYKNREDGNLTLTFFDEENEFAKYEYKLSYQEPKKIHCLIDKEKEVILGWIKDESPLHKKISKDTKSMLQVHAGSGEICFVPFNIENAELIPNMSGKVEMIFANGISQDITDMQIIIF